MPNNAAFVPLETWFYHSPKLAQAGRTIDVGLAIEALVSYDTVYVGFSNHEQFARFVSWFQRQGATNDLSALIADRALVPYYYAFYTLSANVRQTWDLINVQDEEAASGQVFHARILESDSLKGLIHKHSVRERLIRAASENHIEVKAEEFGVALLNAKQDYETAEKSAFLVQILFRRDVQRSGQCPPSKSLASGREPRRVTDDSLGIRASVSSNRSWGNT